MKELQEKLFENPEKERWSVTDIGAADWALWKIKSTEEEYQQALAYLEKQENKIKELKLECQKKLEAETSFFIDKLREWTEEKIKTKNAGKSIKLLNGKVGLRKKPAGVEIEDKTNTLDFCKDKDLDIKLEISLDCKYSKSDEILKLVSGLNVNWKKTPIKKSITDYFKSKDVDSADFPGGRYSKGEEKFYIE